MGNRTEKSESSVKGDLAAIKAAKFVNAFKNIIEIIDNINNLKEEDEPLKKLYLICANSIPKFLGLIKKYKNFLKNKNGNETMEKSFQIELSNYETGNSIKISNNYNAWENKKNKNNDENEFIIVNETILKILEIDNINNTNIEIIIKDNNKIVRFVESLYYIPFCQKNDECLSFQFQETVQNPKINKIDNSQENSIKSNISNKSITGVNYSNSVLKKMEYANKNNINENLDLIPLFFCLSNIKNLVEYFLKEKKNLENSEKIISKVLLETIEEIGSKKNLTNYNKFDILINKFKNDKENNKSEFLIDFLYTNIHNELNEKKNAYVNDDINFSNETDLTNKLYHLRNNFENINKSIISDNFYFELININECLNCKSKLYNIEFAYKIVFGLDEISQFKLEFSKAYLDLKDCFKTVFQSKQDKFYCKTCKQNFNCLSYYNLNSLPEILTIILDRKEGFEYGIEFGIDFQFDLKEYLYKWGNIEPKNTKYELISILTYFKESPNTAIYKSYIDFKWYSYKNGQSELFDIISNEYKGMPYLLFYQRIKEN